MSDHVSAPEDVLAAAPAEYVRPASAWQFAWFLPQNLLIAGLKLYRSIVSPVYGDVCRYFPSCSAYALESVTVHGAVRGLGLSVRRLLRCHPWAAGGIDRVPGGGRVFPDLASVPKIVLLNHPNLAERQQQHPAEDAGPAALGEPSP
jgi:putative membrane protein insertion efficiency factor